MALDRDGFLTDIRLFYTRSDRTDAELIRFLDFGIKHATRKHNWSDLKGDQTYSIIEDDISEPLNAAIRVLHDVRIEKTSPVRNIPLVFLPWDEFSDQYILGTSSTGEPINFSLFGKTMYFGPIPDASYTIGTKETRHAGEPFTDGSGTTESPITQIDDFLVHFAVSWAWATKELATLAGRHEDYWKEALKDAMSNDAKLNAQQRTSGDSVYELVIGTSNDNDYEIP